MGRYKHGMSGMRVHNIWLGMLDRCKNGRQNYGDRGICVCERWHLFKAFYDDMGAPPTSKHSIDRIDVNGNYEPKNCRWATRKEQARNTTRNTILRYNGEERIIAEWSEVIGIKPATICQRLYKYGWSIEKTLTKRPLLKLPIIKPWTILDMSRSSWYRAGRPGI